VRGSNTALALLRAPPWLCLRATMATCLV